MHTTTVKSDGLKWECHHNGDFSGDVFFTIETYHPERRHHSTDEPRVEFTDMSTQREKMSKLIHAPDDMMGDHYTVKIPFDVLKQLVAKKLRNDMMERLEEMEADELLASRVKVVLDV